jgi:16S rRNA U516 pseudouridylate synthase RsuA-like enzyme
VDWKNFAENEKGATGHVKCESPVDGLLLLDIEGVFHHKFLRQGQTVNRWYYLEMQKRVRENIRKKDLSCGETTTGSSIMTMRQLVHHY